MTDARFDEVRADLAAFADDDEEVIVDPRGQCLFVRAGQEITFQLVQDEQGNLVAQTNDSQRPYRQFLAHELARLDILAERIVAKRPPVPAYVDSQAVLETSTTGTIDGTSLELLRNRCSAPAAFMSRVLFVTADAGQGKTALLRQFQFEQAQRFLTGDAGFVFWHVDLQGRQLLRLSEALMGDISDLRVSGLWMPAVIRLLRHRVLVLAIDGFDELAAEQGGNDALGALSMLVGQMSGQGTIVAASRRTFFDTDDYISRARLFARTSADESEFDQLSLSHWAESEARAYLRTIEVEGQRFENPDAVYDGIVSELGDPSHTMLSRPFLLAQIARALLRFDMSASSFIRGMDDPLRGVGAVIETFVEREVSEKWKHKDSGEPYLTKEQHLRFLSDVAEEMFRSQRSSLSVDVVETIATLLFDEWATEQVNRQQILQMVRMHVLLTPPDDGNLSLRTFDHEEFFAWFTAYALKDRMLRLHDEGEVVSHDLLSVAQLSDATASYVCALIERTPDEVRRIVTGLIELVQREWRPTYLQHNVGTLIAYLISDVEFDPTLEIDAEVVYSSVVFESSRLSGVHLKNGAFVSASFAKANWRNVVLENCDLGEPTFSNGACYEAVELRNCTIGGIRVIRRDGEEVREYAPERVASRMSKLGIEAVASLGEPVDIDDAPSMSEGETRKLVKRVLNLFRRTTFLSENTVKHRFPRDHKRVLDDVLPLMQKHDLVEPKPWKGSGKQLAWGLSASLERIEKADGDEKGPLRMFWSEVDEADGNRRSTREG